MLYNLLNNIIFLVILLSGLFLFSIYCIRYFDSKEIIFRLIGKKYNISNIVYLNRIDIKKISKILSLNTKGKFIEHNIGIPAWYPVISLESSDNDDWEKVKKNFLLFVSEVNINSNINKFEEIIINQTTKIILTNITIDSVQISKIVVNSFCILILNKELNEIELELFYQGSVEWRKQIAMKGLANIEIKYKCIEQLIKLIKSNKNIYDIFGEKWLDPFYYSVIMQPFIISPMINVPDIMVNYSILLKKKKNFY